MKSSTPVFVSLIALTLFTLPASARSKKSAAPAQVAPAQGRVLDVPPPDDTAKFLAGMPVSKNSPLAALTQDPAWLEHSAYFEKAFSKLNTRQLNKLHTFQDTNLPETKNSYPVAYYMFSGPDFLYLDQFFPAASVYVMCGQEALGLPPDPLKIQNLPAALHNLEAAMHDSLTTSYFITQDMKVSLQQQNLSGVVPILYVFLARAGKTINEVNYISLGNGGNVQFSRGSTPGVRIIFTDNRSHRKQTLYYFTTDISDGGISSNGAFMNFCRQFGVGASFLKSSSYLMFEDGFSRVRNFLLDHSNIIVQDDSGIPIANFNRDKWNLRLFGTYVGPIALFQQHYQSRLRDLFNENPAPPLTIGFGYQWNFHKSNLIVATRK